MPIARVRDSRPGKFMLFSDRALKPPLRFQEHVLAPREKGNCTDLTLRALLSD